MKPEEIIKDLQKALEDLLSADEGGEASPEFHRAKERAKAALERSRQQ